MMVGIFETLSRFTIPVFIIFILGYGFYKKVPVYEAFIEGAKEGFTTVIRIVPYLVAMLVAIGVFRSSGAMELLFRFISPVTNLLGIPADLLPLAFMRPLSGSASIGILAEMLKVHGADSFIGRTASTMMGSTETTFYTASIYFGSVGLRDTRYVLIAGLLTDLVGFLSSIVICSMVFGR
jgi:spore maturation protein B